MSEREEVRREFSFENAIPGGPWYTLDVDKVLDEIVRLREALAAREVAQCSACHGEGEVSEHECCGQSTSGECCGNSVEVRVPCLFCGNKALAAATRVTVNGAMVEAMSQHVYQYALTTQADIRAGLTAALEVPPDDKSRTSRIDNIPKP